MDNYIDIDLLSKNFKRNNIPVLLIEDRNALIDFLRKSIPANSVVGVGDSVTLEETGVYDFLRNETYQFLDKYQPHLSKDEKRQLYINNFSADFFLIGKPCLFASFNDSNRATSPSIDKTAFETNIGNQWITRFGGMCML